MKYKIVKNMYKDETIYIPKYNGKDTIIITKNNTIIIKQEEMKIKNNADITKLDNKIKLVIENIENACKKLEGKNYEITITSGNDGIHMKNSKHYENLAIDIRIKDMNYPLGNCLNIRKTLGKDYDVILENDHIHIEYEKR
jgi:hypothetical protein